MKKLLIAAVVGVSAMVAAPSADGQNTYTWADNAQGQQYLQCNAQMLTLYWPTNSNWSQSMHTSSNCDNSGLVISQPSNWSPAPAEGLYPGGPGLTGVNLFLGSPSNTLLEATVTINNLTLSTNGRLTIARNGILTATNIDLQGDGMIGSTTNLASMQMINITPGGSLTKSGGAGIFAFGGNDSPNDRILLFCNYANLVVQSGTLQLPFGNGSLLYNSTLSVSNNATDRKSV